MAATLTSQPVSHGAAACPEASACCATAYPSAITAVPMARQEAVLAGAAPPACAAPRVARAPWPLEQCAGPRRQQRARRPRGSLGLQQHRHGLPADGAGRIRRLLPHMGAPLQRLLPAGAP